MKTLDLTEEKLKKIIKKSVKEAVAVELMKLRSLVIATAADIEQEEIEKKYGEPSKNYGRSFDLDL